MSIESEVTMTPADYIGFADWLMKNTVDDSLLVFKPSAIPVLTACIAVCQRDNVFAEFLNALKRLAVNRGTQVVLYADGRSSELSFSLGWYDRPFSEYPDGWKFYSDPKPGQMPFMMGGLIYRGPDRGYPGNPYKEHSWTIHT